MKLSLFRHPTKIFVYCTVYIHLSFLHPPPTYPAHPAHLPSSPTQLNMRANEEEIPSVPDTAPKAVQKLQKAKNKPSVQEILDSIEPPSSTYRPIQVEDRLSQPKLPSGLVTPLDFFSLFITSSMLEQISEFTNTKAQKAERTAKQRLWVPTSGAEIGVFMGILLSMGLISINRTKSYWDTHSDMHGNPEIPQAMSLNRFEQIKRFLKLSDPNTNPEPKSSGYESSGQRN